MVDTDERVVLLADDGTPLGVAPKRDVHHLETPLHLAFSCHVLDDRGRLLLTRRALAKTAWPGVWTNAFCGHPGPFEPIPDAVHRRAEQELSLRLRGLRLVLPDFRYRAVDASGVVENEICPVYVATADADLRPNPDEVVETQWAEPADLARAAAAAPWAFSPWLVSQLDELTAPGIESGIEWEGVRT